MHFTEFKITLQLPQSQFFFANLYISISKPLLLNYNYSYAIWQYSTYPCGIHFSKFALCGNHCEDSAKRFVQNHKNQCSYSWILPLIRLCEVYVFKNTKINLKQHVKLVPKNNYIINSVIILFKMIGHAKFWISYHRKILLSCMGCHVQTYWYV